MERAEFTRPIFLIFSPNRLLKRWMPVIESEGYTYFNFPMDHHEFIESGGIGNPLRAMKEKGRKLFGACPNMLHGALRTHGSSRDGSQSRICRSCHVMIDNRIQFTQSVVRAFQPIGGHGDHKIQC